jgi:hypothetical protein
MPGCCRCPDDKTAPTSRPGSLRVAKGPRHSGREHREKVLATLHASTSQDQVGVAGESLVEDDAAPVCASP